MHRSENFEDSPHAQGPYVPSRPARVATSTQHVRSGAIAWFLRVTCAADDGLLCASADGRTRGCDDSKHTASYGCREWRRW